MGMELDLETRFAQRFEHRLSDTNRCQGDPGFTDAALARRAGSADFCAFFALGGVTRVRLGKYVLEVLGRWQ